MVLPSLGSLRITITADTKFIAHWLGNFTSQMPFATALALTRVAEAARDRVRTQLPGDFIIRNQWTAGGIRHRPATKRTLQSAVGSLDPYMASQGEGGTRQPGQGVPRGRRGRGKALAVPGKALRRSKTGLVRRSQWPHILRLKKRHFFATLKSGAVALFRRRGKTSHPIQVLWIFRRRVRLPKKWKATFKRDVAEAVAANWAREARAALMAAMTTARR